MTLSHQPRKTRKALAGQKAALNRFLLNARLSDQLREKYHRRSLEVRKGDTIKILRGDFKNVEGKVQKANPKDGSLTVEGVTREKVKGGTVQLAVNASKVMLTNLSLDDKRRKARLESGGS